MTSAREEAAPSAREEAAPSVSEEAAPMAADGGVAGEARPRAA